MRGKKGESRGAFHPHSLPFPSFLFTPKMGRKEEVGKIFNSSPPLPSIPFYNISKQGDYKSCSFPFLPLHYLPLSFPPFPLYLNSNNVLVMVSWM